MTFPVISSRSGGLEVLLAATPFYERASSTGKTSRAEWKKDTGCVENTV